MSSFWLAVTTSVIWGIVPLLEKVGLVKTAPLLGLFYRCFGVFIGLIVLSFFFIKPDEMRSIDPKSAALLITAGFLASFVAQITFYNALKGGEMSRVVLISGSYPLIAFLLGVLILGESVTLFKVIGAALIIFGLFMLKIG